MHRTLNGTWGEFNFIILILAIIVAVYFYIQVYKIKDELNMNPDLFYNKMISIIAILIFLALVTKIISF